MDRKKGERTNTKKTAYCGVEGAYAYIAAQKLFPDSKKISFGSFLQAYGAVESGECDNVVLPVENSCAGEVGSVLDIMFTGELYVNQMLEMPIHHNLLVLMNAKENDIKTVISHPQALEQCMKFINGRGYEIKSCSNTAAAAKSVRDSADGSVAAIASKESAELFGLKIIRAEINDAASNTTRFAALSKKRTCGKSGAVLAFTVENKAGALAKALGIIGCCGFDLKSIHSRPMKTLKWEYYFYAEIQGNVNSKEGKDMLCQLSKSCKSMKIVGTY